MDHFFLNCDAENKELILLGDINCDVAKSPPESHTIRFQSINTLYNMAQLIEEPTRVARTSATIIDLILTNVPEIIPHSGVIPVGISDHSVILYMQFTNSNHLNVIYLFIYLIYSPKSVYRINNLNKKIFTIVGLGTF